ncbi:hypothetical protein ACFQE8_23285 [Salinirubellus sp. GCM10025818]|uniref:hypothetical protein n=1 Tax=unclassified Salinirubellus TaxID=2627207 RepID=UPI003614D0BD
MSVRLPESHNVDLAFPEQQRQWLRQWVGTVQALTIEIRPASDESHSVWPLPEDVKPPELGHRLLERAAEDVVDGQRLLVGKEKYGRQVGRAPDLATAFELNACPPARDVSLYKF